MPATPPPGPDLNDLLARGRFREALPGAEAAAASGGPAAFLLLARVQRELGHYAAAEKACLDALPLLATGVGKDHPDYATGLAELAGAYTGLARFERAEGLSKQAAELRTRVLGASHPATLAGRHDLAELVDLRGRWREAEALIRQVVTGREVALGADHPDTGASRVSLGWVISGLGRWVESVELVRRGLAALTAGRPKDHPDRALALHRLGTLLSCLWRHAEARPLLEEALKHRRARLGEDHPLTASSLTTWACVLAAEGDTEEAEAEARQALATLRAALGEEHPFLAYPLEGLARVLDSAGKSEEALDLAREASERFAAAHGPGHPRAREALADRARLLIGLGRPAEAEGLVRARLPGDPPPAAEEPEQTTCFLWMELARALLAQNRPGDARGPARAALAGCRAVYGGDHPGLSEPLQLLAGVEQANRNPDQARALLEEARALLNRTAGAEAAAAGPLQLLASLHGERGQPAEAEPLLREALEILGRAPRATTQDRFGVMEELAGALLAQGKDGEADQLYQRLLREREEALGRGHPDVARTHLQLANLYEATGQAQAAEARYQQGAQLLQTNPGPESPECAGGLTALAGFLHRAGRLNEALGLLRQATDIYLAAGGGEPSLALARAQQAQGVVCRDLGDLDQARRLLESALSVYQGHPGEADADARQAAHDLALAEQAAGEVGPAERRLRAVLADARATRGERHPDLIPLLTDLASLLTGVGDHLAAEPLLSQVVTIAESLGPNNPRLIGALMNQAGLARAMGEPAEGVRLAERALELTRALLGDDSLQVSAGRLALAEAYVAAGQTDQAAAQVEASLESRRAALGRSHQMVIEGVVKLAEVRFAQGRHEDGEDLLRQAVDLIGKGQIEAGSVVRLLASARQAVGDLEGAETHLRHAVGLLSKPAGESHPMLVPLWNQLADLCRERGNYAEAEQRYRATLATVRGAGGEDNPASAPLLHGLALTLLQEGRTGVGEPFLREALAVRREHLGATHPLTLDSTHLLAAVCAATGRAAEAAALTAEAVEAEDTLATALPALPDPAAREGYARSLLEGLRRRLTLNRLAPGRPGDVLNQVLRRKGLLSAALAVPPEERHARRATDRELLREYVQLRRQIAAREVAGPGPEGRAVHADLLARWRTRLERVAPQVEAELPALARRGEAWRADRAAVAAALPAGAVLIEFVRFEPLDYDRLFPREGGPRAAPRYQAFVLPAGRPDAAPLTDLGEAGLVDELTAAWHAAARRGDAARAAEALQGLARRLIQPIAPHLAGATRVVVAPDGALAGVPFAALPLGEGKVLLDAGPVSLVPTGRETLHFGAGRPPGKPGLDMSVAAPTVPGLPARPTWWSRLLAAVGLGGPRPPYPLTQLDGAAAESALVARLTGARAFIGDMAVPVAIMGGGARFLHLAAPGWRVERPEGPRLWTNSLADRGLTLTGPDGKISGERITGLDLTGLELLVLSLPVEQPLLARCFLLAGARSVLTTCCDLPLAPRVAFLEEFLPAVKAGTPPGQACFAAQMRLRERFRGTAWWAAFSLWGDPGNWASG